MTENDQGTTSNDIIVNNESIFSHRPHTEIFVSLLINCGCSLSNIAKTSCRRDGHNMVCENCDFSCFELHKLTGVTTNYENSTITYDVRYKIAVELDGYGRSIECFYSLEPTIDYMFYNTTAHVMIESYSESNDTANYILSKTYVFWVFSTDDSSGAIIESNFTTVVVDINEQAGYVSVRQE